MHAVDRMVDMAKFGKRGTRMSSADQAQRSSSVSTSSDMNSVNERIASAIADLRYGTVEITIHDGKVVQIERTEKIRFQGDSTGRTAR
jgi:hypothetical protein